MSSLSIRVAAVSDADSINRIYNHYVRNTTITFDLQPWSTRRREQWIGEFANFENPYHAVVAEMDGEIAGFAYNSNFRARAAYQRSTETSVYTNPQTPPCGAGIALYDSLFDRIEKTDLHRAYAVITLPNPRSIAFHQRFGFSVVGTLHQVGYKFGRYVDVSWFEKKLK